MSSRKGCVFLCALLPLLVVVVQAPPSAAPPCTSLENYMQAKMCCVSKGVDLPKASNDKNINYLRNKLRERKINSTWINIKRDMMSAWKWIDGKNEEFDHWIPNSHGCGWFNQKSKRVEPGSCYDRTVGSICSFNDSKCPRGILSFIGVSFKGVCYTHHCEGLTWHEARAHCQIQGFSLAKVRDQELVEVLSKKTWACNRFWVGLRREEWVDDNDSPVDIIYDHWNPHHHPDEGCGYAQVAVTSWIFTPRFCDSEQSFTCGIENPGLTTLTIQDSTFDAGHNYQEFGKMMLGTFLSVAVVTLLAFIIICIWRRKQNQQNLQHEFVEMKNLLEKGEGRNTIIYIQRHIAREISRNFNYTEVWDWEDETSSVELDELYTDLVFVEKKRTQLFPEERPLDFYTDMLSKVDKWHSVPKGELEGFHRVYIEGAAGTGKTTLAKRLLMDWARYILAGWWSKTFLMPRHIKRRMRKFKLVLPIFLRDVSKDQSLMEAVLQIMNIDVEEEKMASIIENHQRNILFLCEGLDEYRDDTASEITRLLRRNKLKQTNLLITSRNHPSLHFRSTNELPTTHVILKGFSAKGVEIYTDRFFKGNGYSLREEISKSEDRKDLSRYPAVLLLMCVLWRDNKTLADSVTGFYFDFLKYICGRYERKYLNQDEYAIPEEIVDKYHQYFMEIGRIAADGLKGDTLQLNFHPSAIKDLTETARKLGFFNLNEMTLPERTESRKRRKRISFQHKTFQEYMAAYYIVHCDPELRHGLLLQFLRSPNAIKEADMLVTFLQGLGKDVISDLVRDIIEGSESHAAKTNTAVHLAFLLDSANGSIILPQIIELELSRHYTPDVIKRFFAMNCSAVTKITIWAPSVEHIKYLMLMQKSHLTEVTVCQLETGFIDDSDFKIQGKSTQVLRIERLRVDGFRKLTADNITFLYSITTEKSHITISTNISDITVPPKPKWGNAGLGISVQCIFVQTKQLEVLDLAHNITEGNLHELLGGIISELVPVWKLCLGTCNKKAKLSQEDEDPTYLQSSDKHKDTFNTEIEKDLARHIFPSLSVINLDIYKTNDTGRPLVYNISDITVIDMRGILVSSGVCTQIAVHLKVMLNLRILYLCKCDTVNAIEPVINDIGHTFEIEILDISGNISNPEPYEILDVRGRTTGNKVTLDVYKTLGDRMTSLTKLRELRLCECDDPFGLIPVVKSLHHVTQLQSLDLSGNKANSSVFKILGKQLKHLVKLRVLRLCVSDKRNVVRHVIDNLYLVPDINILDISGLKAKFAKRGVFSELYNMSNSIDKTIYPGLGDQLQHLNDLRELRLCRCNDVDAVIKGLRHTARLHTLDLLRNEVKYDVFTELGRQLSNLVELRELRLCYCSDHNAVRKIVEHLHDTPGLVVLDLTGTVVAGEEHGVKTVNINTAGRAVYETLSRQLQRLPRLRELRVCKCRYDDRGQGGAVVDGLRYTPGLQVLQMARWSLDAAGVEQLGERLVNLREIRQLLLVNCDVYDIYDEYIQPDTSHKYIQIHKAWNKCVSQLSMLSQLQVLTLENNNMGNDSVVQLSRQLTSLTNLDTLIMFRCGLTDTQAVIQLIDQLPSCPSLRILNVRDNHLGDGLEQIVNMTLQLSRLYKLDLEYNKMSASVVRNIKRQLEQKLPDLTLSV